jgi:hypothetical protein
MEPVQLVALSFFLLRPSLRFLVVALGRASAGFDIHSTRPSPTQHLSPTPPSCRS